MEAHLKRVAPDARKVLGQRVARAVIDIDQLASSISGSLARAKTSVVRDLGRLLVGRAQAMRLAVNMELTSERLIATCDDLKSAAQQMKLMCTKTRLDEGTKLAVGLIAKLTNQLSVDLQEWDQLEAD